MMSVETYRTLAAPAEAEIKEKGSRFIAFAYPVKSAEEVKRHVDNLRELHHKARHWCYAYRLGTEGNQFRANDDGEPSGSAGRPILGQIDSFELTDTLVVVVRYFGGTLLGVPGLIQAYKGSTLAALETAEIEVRNIERTFYLRCGYPHLNDAIRIARQHQGEVVAQDLQLDCRLSVRVPLATAAAAEAAWRQTRQIEVSDQSFDLV